MTLTGLMPARLAARRERPVRKHRAPDEIERQRWLRAGADLLIKALYAQLDDKDREHEETVARLDERYGAIIRQLETELADARSRLEVRNWADSVVTQTQELPVEEIRRHCTPVPLHQSPQAHRDEPEPAA